MIYNDLYTVTYSDNENATIVLSDNNHPVFQAHFPSNPILPGFIHFEIVSDIFDLDIQTIKKAKFTKIISPSQTLKYEKKANKFKIFCENEEVASFTL